MLGHVPGIRTIAYSGTWLDLRDKPEDDELDGNREKIPYKTT
jgi:hypothetical protein